MTGKPPEGQLYLATDASSRLQKAISSARLIVDLSDRCLAAMADSGLAESVHGTPCHELVRTYMKVCATEASKIRATLDAGAAKLEQLSDATTG